MEREKKAQDISDSWQANNLTYDGIKEVLKDLGIKEPKKKPDSEDTEKVNKDWRRLKNFMSKQGR